MTLSIRTVAVAVFTGLILALIGAAPASATTFCVPAFHPACPNNGTNQPQADLQTAMATLGNDGIPDKIVIDAVTLSPPGSIHPVPFYFAEDPLEVVGAGTAKTRITSSTGGNIFILNLANTNFSQRHVTMHDLSIVVPPNVGMSSASAVQSARDTFENVDFVSQDPSTGAHTAKGAGSIIDGGVFRNVKFYGESGGRFGKAIVTGTTYIPDPTLEIDHVNITDTDNAIDSFSGTPPPITVKSSHFDVGDFAVATYEGFQTTIQNSVIESGQYQPFFVGPNSSLTLLNSTIIGRSGSPIAIRLSLDPGDSGSANVVVKDSIIRGFPKTWMLEAPVSPADGNANLDISYSNLSSSGTKTGDGTLNVTNGVINEDPLFKGLTDYHLGEGSPSIDAGDPAAGGLLDDIEGTIRPLDGNGDGTAARDQGAYEAPTLATCANTASLCPDTTKPVVSKVKFKAPKKKAGSLKFRLSEAATVKATFKPIPPKKKPKRKAVKLSNKAKAGANTLKLKKGKLKKGKYRLTITATDLAGNKAKTFTRKVRVK